MKFRQCLLMALLLLGVDAGAAQRSVTLHIDGIRLLNQFTIVHDRTPFFALVVDPFEGSQSARSIAYASESSGRFRILTNFKAFVYAGECAFAVDSAHRLATGPWGYPLGRQNTYETVTQWVQRSPPPPIIETTSLVYEVLDVEGVASLSGTALDLRHGMIVPGIDQTGPYRANVSALVEPRLGEGFSTGNRIVSVGRGPRCEPRRA